ncbi:hypothetical protein [Humisphaera borealis]|uniref:Uncharacterized protein n=1 Tax=Humisphaera borealis TaxID=2807512 RepID=A0A7M2WS72_9BACT|nr:hypothetical protein [Humisphaera borealis]QOV87641.1 hypothetical protein IPV69_15245 [Humisphaera borealis]
MRSLSSARLSGLLAVVVSLALIVGCDSGCATSKPFATGVTKGVPLMEHDLRHYAGIDPLRLADVDALIAATRDESKVDAVVVERSWTSVKSWYLPAIDASPTLDAEAKAATWPSSSAALMPPSTAGSNATTGDSAPAPGRPPMSSGYSNGRRPSWSNVPRTPSSESKPVPTPGPKPRPIPPATPARQRSPPSAAWNGGWNPSRSARRPTSR